MSKTKQNKVETIQGKVNAVEWVAKHNGYPEVGQFVDQKSLQKFYKQLPIETLEDWAKVEGIEYKACTESAPIHRMRVAMAILGLHFPKQTASKPESPYKKYTTECLIEMAIENDVAVETTEDERIMRMRTIMALKAAKILE
jgi:hypothetical protein